MTTTTIRSCDFCGSKQLPTDRDRWGMLVIGPVRHAIEGANSTVDGYISGEPRDVCPVCIARLRQVAGAA